jgi:hypothetical protein
VAVNLLVRHFDGPSICWFKMEESPQVIIAAKELLRMTDPNLAHTDLLTKIYAAFNRRDIDTVLANMAADVDWPNGMEGGRVHGHEEVRQYWLRQWSQINPRVEPQGFRADPSGAAIVDVHQVIRDLEGSLLLDRMVEHVYVVRNGLIHSMEIRETDSPFIKRD